MAYPSRLVATAALCLALSASAALAEIVEIESARGRVEVPIAPHPIAVFDIPAIDTLQALGVIPDGVPGNLLVPYLSEVAAKAEPVGTLFEPDLEALVALAPALIIAGGRSSDQVESLSRVAPTLDMTIDTADFVGDVKQRLADYGRMFDREREADALAGLLDTRLEGARAAAADEGRALIIMTNGPKLSAFGAGSRFGWLHSAIGLPQAHAGVEAAGHGDAISFEFVAETDPDWLIVLDRGAAIGAEGASARETLSNPLVESTKAWQSGQVFYLDPSLYIAGGGYTSLMTTLEDLIAAFSG